MCTRTGYNKPELRARGLIFFKSLLRINESLEKLLMSESFLNSNSLVNLAGLNKTAVFLQPRSARDGPNLDNLEFNKYNLEFFRWVDTGLAGASQKEEKSYQTVHVK